MAGVIYRLERQRSRSPTRQIAATSSVDGRVIMSSLGRFLELSVKAPEILNSLAFYKGLGFTELEIADALRCSERTVRSDWRKARAAIRVRIVGSASG